MIVVRSRLQTSTNGGRTRNSTDKVDNKLSVYPNPTSGVLNINGLDGRDGIASIKLYSMDGLVVLEQSLSNTMHNPNIELIGINAGIYILELSIDGINALTQKVVVTK